MRSGPSSAPRVFVDAPLSGDRVRIGEREAHYLNHVLRLKVGNDIVVFDGRGCERAATISSLSRRHPELTLGGTLPALPESGAHIVLLQGLIKSDAMDLVVQKATELGVRRIMAVKTDYSVIKLDPQRSEKREAHWARIARSACEQSRRHFVPEIGVARSLSSALETLPPHGVRLALHKEADARFAALEPDGEERACLAIGPEGGFSPAELDQLTAAGFHIVALGPRTLRAETAAIAACTLAQLKWGDLA